MVAAHWEGVPEAVRDRVAETVGDERPLALVQVGSTARGYALPGSDYDFIAFYGDERARSSVDSDAGGVRVSVELSSLPRFMESVSDFRFNLASLRQLHKVRDGIQRGAPGAGTDHLLRTAAAAHLDRIVVLAQCSLIAERAPGVKRWPAVAQHQQLISWTEWLGTVEAVSRPGAEAYSKPKWLHRTLEKTGATETLELLQRLYRPDVAEARTLLAELEQQWAADRAAGLRHTRRGSLIAALDDARAAVEHFPASSFTQLRYTAGQIHRLSREHPVAVLAAGGTLEPAIAAAMRCGADVELTGAWTAFRALYGSVAREAVADARRVWMPPLGSRRFFADVLGFYDATDLMPHAAEDRVMAMIAVVEDFAAGA